MGPPPLVSFLVPVRDEEAFLDDALASLAAQTVRDWEAVVVDDGSRDATAAIAEAWAARDGRFRVVRQERLGVVAAAERARAAAQGAFLANMDGDDRARPERLALQLAALEAEGLDAAGGGVAYFGPVTDGLRRYEAWLNSLTTVEAVVRDRFVEMPVAHPALLVRRQAHPGWRDVPWPEDYDLVLRLLAGGARVRNVAEVVHDWRDHGTRLSRTSERYSTEAFASCKAAHLRDSVLRGRPAVVWGSGPVGKLHARELRAAGVDVVAFVDLDPRKLGKRIYGIPVLNPDDGAALRDAVAVGAVAGPEARERLRGLARDQGRVEGDDFVAVA